MKGEAVLRDKEWFLHSSIKSWRTSGEIFLRKLCKIKRNDHAVHAVTILETDYIPEEFLVAGYGTVTMKIVSVLIHFYQTLKQLVHVRL
jgi:hypothetical protein